MTVITCSLIYFTPIGVFYNLDVAWNENNKTKQEYYNIIIPMLIFNNISRRVRSESSANIFMVNELSVYISTDD